MITRRAFILFCVFSCAGSIWLLRHGPETTNHAAPQSSTLHWTDDGSTATTRVLIARSVSSLEVDNVLADASTILSYQESSASSDAYLLQSLSRCNALLNTTNVTVDPFAYNRSETLPNRILCDEGRTNQGNNYVSVEAAFLFFARDGSVAATISSKLDDKYAPYVTIVDVSASPRKIWNWIMRLTNSALIGYDYVWMVDGDLLLRTLNWHGFWQQVKLVRPKISQPSVIGTGRGKLDSYHEVLRHPRDSRVLAAEVAIVEVMMPLFEVETWLGFREALLSLPNHGEIIHLVKEGGENCFDVSWCHYAKTNWTGVQAKPSRSIGYDGADDDSSTYSSRDDFTHGEFKERSCVVFGQTPLVHGDKKSLTKTYDYRLLGGKLCDGLRKPLHLVSAADAGSKVYDIFVAPL